MKSIASMAFGLHDAPVLLARPDPGLCMSITEIRCDLPDFRTTRSMGYHDMYMVVLQMCASPDHELYLDGVSVPVTPIVSGVTMLQDLRQDPIAVLRSPFHSLYFQLTHDALDRIADYLEVPRIASLDFSPGCCIDDSIVRRLMGCLAPALSCSNADAI